MAFCNKCKADVTLTPTTANKCPACGADLFAPEAKSPGDTSREEDFIGEMTVAFTPGGITPFDEEESESGITGVELDFTQVFGGKFVEDNDLSDDSGLDEIALDEIALDEAPSPNVTQALGSSPGGSSDPSSRSGETLRREDSSTSPEATHAVGSGADDSGQSEWPSGVTVPTGLSGSDRASSLDAPDTHREAETIMHDSGTLAMGSGRRSSEIHTPHSREITGLSSGRTIPRGPLGEGGASRSLKAGDVQFVGPEQVRLRAFGLSEGTDSNQDVDFLLRASAGKGGMGIVYRSLQRSLDRDVAVKQMKPDLADSESDRNKFLTEAVITGQLEHPNIIPVHELGLAADGLPFYAMKYVIGDDWEDRLKKLSEQENLNILIQVANAIAFAHSRNVIHRDLKPGNVRLGNFGEVLVMDWGLAARLDREGDIPPAGTPLYMAPETALEYLDHVGQQSSAGQSKSSRRIKAGTYSDIYLLGALLFKIVTGKAPHTGKTPFECLRNAAKNRIIKVERTSELLDIAYKAMATNPADRYRSVPEFVEALKAYQSHAQSIQIARRAAEDLADAEEQSNAPGVNSTATYAIFSSAQHGFQNALDLWTENRKAREQLGKCRQSFAAAAYTNGDYDLALSLLDGEEDADPEMVTNIRRSQRLRQTRLKWFRTLQYATAASLVAALTFIGFSFKLGNDLFSAKKKIADAEVTLVNVQKEADDKVAAADREAKEKVVQAEKDAGVKIAEADREAKAKISQAEKDASLKIADADANVIKAKELATQFEQEARNQEYFATIGAVRSNLLERGPYYAWTKLQEVDQKVIDGASEENKEAWTRLMRDVDWQSEASELVSVKLTKPLLAVTNNGRWLASVGEGDEGPQLLIFDASDFTKPVHTVKLAHPAYRLAISPDGRFAATVSDVASGERLSLIDVQTGRELQFAPDSMTNAGTVTAIAFDPSSKRLLTGSNKDKGSKLAKEKLGILTEWNIDETGGTVVPHFSEEGAHHQHQVTAVGYSPDNKLAFTADSGGTLWLWERSNPARLTRKFPYRHREVASGTGEITAATWGTPTEEYAPLAYACSDGNVYLLQIPLMSSKNVKNDDSIATSAGSKKSVHLVSLSLPPDMTTDPSLRPDKMSNRHDKRVTDLAFAKDGAVLLSSGGDTIFVHDVAGGDIAGQNLERKEMRRYHDTGVTSCAAGDGDSAYSSDEKGRVLQWKIDVPRDSQSIEPETRTGKVTDIDVSSGNLSRVAVTDSGGFTRVWLNENQPELLDKLVIGHANDQRMDAWHIPGPEPLIVTVAEDRRACLWNAATGELLRPIDLGLRSVVAISVDDEALLAATELEPDADKPGYTLERIQATAFALNEITPPSLWKDYSRVSTMLSLRRGANDAESTIAVGLRDGQIFLWRSDQGRISLADAIQRPHWQPISAFAHNADANILYAADSTGLISRWELRNVAPVRHESKLLNKEAFESVSRLEVSADGSQILAVVKIKVGTEDSCQLRLLDSNSLEMSEQQPTQIKDLVDATFASDGKSILAVTGQITLQKYEMKNQQWHHPNWASKVAKSLAGASITGVRVDAEGNLLLFGPGFAQLWKDTVDDTQMVSHIRSRPSAQLVEFRSGDPNKLRSLSAGGKLDSLSSTESDHYERKQKVLAALRGVTSACSAPREGEAYLAIRDANVDATRIELWNLDEGKSVKTIADPFQGVCSSLASNVNRVAYATYNRGKAWVNVVNVVTDETSDPIELPPGSRVTSLSLSPLDDRLIVCTKTGAAFVVESEANGKWQVSEIDRDDISVAIFSPQGERLILGTTTGQVQIVKPQASDEGLIPRLLLTLPGHSHPVTALQFADRESKLTLLSGDAAGRVLVHPLE